MSNAYGGAGNERGYNVSKTYIPGVGYRAATRLPKRVLRRAASEKWKPHPDPDAMSPGEVSAYRGFGTKIRREQDQAVPTGVKNISYSGSPEDLERLRPALPRKGAKRPVVIRDLMDDDPVNDISDETAFAMARFGPRRPASVTLSDFHLERPETVAHELTHATPRRNMHRMRFDPKQRGREEARADTGGLSAVGRASTGTSYEAAGLANRKTPGASAASIGGDVDGGEYMRMRAKLGKPIPPTKVHNRAAQEYGQELYDYQMGTGGSIFDDPFFGKRDVVIDLVPTGRVAKAATTMSEDEAAQIVEQYGSQGRLPRDLSRDDRMRAYEARYVAAGGPRAEKWGNRAKHLENASAVGQGATGIGALGVLASRKPRTAKLSTAGLLGGAATAGLTGAAAHHARRQRSAYSSSPAGVAASALTRMRNYSPEG